MSRLFCVGRELAVHLFGFVMLSSVTMAATYTYPDDIPSPPVTNWDATAGIASGDTVILNSFATASSSTNPVVNAGTLQITAQQNSDPSNPFLFNLGMSGSGSVAVTDGFVFLGGTNTYSGGTTVSAGTLFGTPLSLQGNVAVDGAVAMYDPNNPNLSGTFSGNLSNGGRFRILTNGTITWTGTNTMGNTARIQVESGRLVGTTANLTGEFENDSTGTVEFNQTTNGTFTGRFFDPQASGTYLGNIVKSGAGDLTWSSFNRSNAGNSGSLDIQQGRVIGPAQSMDITGTVTIATGAQMRIVQPLQADDPNITLSTTIEGSGTVVKAGPGTVDMTNATSNYSSLTTVEEGKLAYQAGRMPYNPNTQTYGEITMTGTGVGNATGISIYSGGQVQVEVDHPGLLSGTGSVTVTGNSELVLSAANTYTGGTFVEDGHVIGTTATIPGPYTLSGNNAIVEFRQASNGTVSSAITGAGGIVKSGAGTLTIAAGSGSLQGGILVEAGTLLINRSFPDIASVTVEGASTLGGSGTISSNQQFFTGINILEGNLSPGNSAGIITTNDLTLSSGGQRSAIIWELMGNTAAAGDRGTLYDGIDLTNGNLTIADGSVLDLVFNAAGSNVNWFNSLWDQNQSWALIDGVVNPNVPSGVFSTLNLSLDSVGGDLATLRPGAGFTAAVSGGDVVINYTSAQLVPEPAVLGVAAIVAAGGLQIMRRRRIVRRRCPRA